MVFPEILGRFVYRPKKLKLTTSGKTNERDLLIRLQNGDDAAFETIYRLYRLPIYANILRMVHDETAADDLLQEVFLRVWENRDKIDPDKSFGGYLFTCSRFMILNFLRHTSIEKQVENYLSRTQSEIYRHIEEGIFSREAEAFIQKTINELPPQRLKIYTLCKTQGMTYQEVAATLGISPTTVQDHMVKARRFIRDRVSNADMAVIAGFICSQLLIR